MLRVLIRHGIDIGWLSYDPSLGIKRPKIREIRSWTDDEIQRFEQHWPIGTKERIAFALMLYTGQRRSDVHRMTWADVSERTIRVVPCEVSGVFNLESSDVGASDRRPRHEELYHEV
jgi:enterobacteria phage integrase